MLEINLVFHPPATDHGFVNSSEWSSNALLRVMDLAFVLFATVLFYPACLVEQIR